MVIEHFPEFRKPIVDGNGNVQVATYTYYKVGKAVRETKNSIKELEKEVLKNNKCFLVF